jgi:hypothetical protein
MDIGLFSVDLKYQKYENVKCKFFPCLRQNVHHDFEISLTSAPDQLDWIIGFYFQRSHHALSLFE